MDRLDSAVTAAYLNMGQSMPYTEAVDELMEMFKNYQAQEEKFEFVTLINIREFR